MTRLPRDLPDLDMKRRSTKHEPGNSSVMQLESVRDSRSGSSASGNGSTALNSTACHSLQQFSGRKEASLSLKCLPDIKASENRKECIHNKSSENLKPKLQRVRTGSFHSPNEGSRHLFKQSSLKSVNELNENLLIGKKNSNNSALGFSDSVDNILERSYNSSYLGGLGSDIKYTSHTPYFSEWKVSGISHDKVILTSLKSMSETQEVTPEFVQYIRERDSALEEAKNAQGELRETQCKLYDSMLLVDELEQKLKDAEAGQKVNKVGSKKTATTKPKKKTTETSSVKGSISSVKGNTNAPSGGISSRRTSSVSSTRPADGGLYHPPVLDLEPVADSREYYWKLAEKFQTLPMFQVLDAEKKFIEADTDNNGYIDKDELDKVLSDNIGLFTPAQLDAIFKEVDLDNSETLDFYEVLYVLNRLFSRRKTNLPQSVQQNYTKTCNVQ